MAKKQQYCYLVIVVAIIHNKLAIIKEVIIIGFVKLQSIEVQVKVIKMAIRLINEYKNYIPMESNWLWGNSIFVKITIIVYSFFYFEVIF